MKRGGGGGGGEERGGKKGSEEKNNNRIRTSSSDLVQSSQPHYVQVTVTIENDGILGRNYSLQVKVKLETFSP